MMKLMSRWELLTSNKYKENKNESYHDLHAGVCDIGAIRRTGDV